MTKFSFQKKGSPALFWGGIYINMYIFNTYIILFPNSSRISKKKPEIIIIIPPPWFFPLIFPHHQTGQELASYVLTGATGGLGKLGTPNRWDSGRRFGGLEPLGFEKTPRVFLGGGKNKWVFPKVVVPQNGWFIMENPIKMDDLGVPLFLETPTYSLGNTFAKGVQSFYWMIFCPVCYVGNRWKDELEKQVVFVLVGFLLVLYY